MTKARTTPSFVTAAAVAALLWLAPVQGAMAQGYDGLVADDGSNATSPVVSDTQQQQQEQQQQDMNNYEQVFGGDYNSDAIYAPDYHKKRAALQKMNRDAYKGYAEAQDAATAAANAEAAKAAQQAIDARVEAAVNAPDKYATRVDDLKAPPPTMPEGTTTTPQPATTTPTNTGSTSGGGVRNGGDVPTGGARGSVLERMMNAIQ